MFKLIRDIFINSFANFSVNIILENNEVDVSFQCLVLIDSRRLKYKSIKENHIMDIVIVL